MKDIDMNKVHLNWCVDLLRRIADTIDDKKLSTESKLQAIRWYAKQGLKVEREE